MDSTSRGRYLAFAGLVLGIVAAALFTLNFPAVEGLGTKVRLPVFHGAMTWVNLAVFSVLGVLAVAYLITKREGVYRWESALRWIGIPMWIVGSALGLMAALGTWDFTGSKSSPLQVAMEDPRLLAQFWVLLAALALAALPLVVEERRWLAVGDVTFVGIAWLLLLRAILGPGRALHPDSPVMNSEEIAIKLIFFGIVGGIALAAFSAAWLLSRPRRDTALRAEPASASA